MSVRGSDVAGPGEKDCVGICWEVKGVQQSLDHCQVRLSDVLVELFLEMTGWPHVLNHVLWVVML